MLHFFRRHQKVIFIGTTAVVVSSFVFFGTYNTLGAAPHPTHVDKEWVQLVDGSALMQRKALNMSRFLSLSIEDGRGEGPANMFNDGVLEKDILSGQLARLIFMQYEPFLASDVMEKCKILSQYRPYVHPLDQNIAEEKLLTNFEPSLYDVLLRAQKSSAHTPLESFFLLVDGYTKSRKIPYDMIKRVLFFQSQNSSLAEDLSLLSMPIGVFSFTSAQSWFGKRFIDLCAQLICNGAAMARQKGCKVTKEEVKLSLLSNLKNNLGKDPRFKPSQEMLQQAFEEGYTALSLSENQLLELWTDVLLFRKLIRPQIVDISAVSKGVEQKIELAKEVRVIDVYEVPVALKNADFYSVLKMQLYIDSIAPLRLRGDLLSFPKEILPITEIEKKAPELVQKRYLLEYSSVRKKELISSIPLKEIWQWQIDDANWLAVVAAAPSLARFSSASQTERFSLIDALAENERKAVDLLAGEKILTKRPELLKAALLSAEKNIKEVGLSEKVPHPLFVTNGNTQFMSFLDKAPLPEVKDLSAEAIAAQQKLMSYSEDGDHFYCISVKRRDEKKRLLSFDEAKKEGVMDKMLQRKLEEAYPEAKRKEPARFQRSDGSIKGLHQVQDIVAKYAFSDLLRAIENSYVAHFGHPPQPHQTESFSFYVTYRPLHLFIKSKGLLEVDGEDPKCSYGSNSPYQRDIDKQWLLSRQRMEIALSDTSLFLSPKSLDVEVGGISSVVTLKNGSLALVKMVSKETKPLPSESEIEKIKAWATQEKSLEIIADLLEMVHQKNAVRLMQDAEETL